MTASHLNDPARAAEQHGREGVALAARGRLDEAVAQLREAVRLRPDWAEAHSNLGNALRLLGRLDEAVAVLERAVELDPGAAYASLNLGIARAGRGEIEAALACFRSAVRLRPDDHGAQWLLGDALARHGDLAGALACFEAALAVHPGFAPALVSRGTVLHALGRSDAAVRDLNRALALAPSSAEAHQQIGLVLAAQGNDDGAAEHLRAAIALAPRSAEAHNHCGGFLLSRGRITEALARFRATVELRPDWAEARNNLGIAWTKVGDLDAAREQLEAALRLQPDFPDARNNLGVVLGRLGRPDAARACYDRAIQDRPDFAEARRNRALTALAEGDYARGWSEYEWRWRCPDSPPRPFPQPAWNGEDLDGRTILLHAEQGLGDTLQFVRFAAQVKGRGGIVALLCPDLLAGLLAGCPGVDRIVTSEAALPEFEYHAPLMSLPRCLGTTLATIPADVPYLFAEPDRVARWRGIVSDDVSTLRVGVAWRGNPRHPCDRWRSIPRSWFETLAGRPGVRLFGLQKSGDDASPLASDGATRIRDLVGSLGPGPDSFPDLAAAMANLDLIITVDTAVAHLAGALGRPTWVALPYAADWRWLAQRTDSPWYPMLRLFRQPALGAWDAVFRDLSAALGSWVSPRARPS